MPSGFARVAAVSVRVHLGDVDANDGTEQDAKESEPTRHEVTGSNALSEA